MLAIRCYDQFASPGPAIACPQKYGISDEDLPPNVSRGLILASKLLQAMPSKREFREEYMQVCYIHPPKQHLSLSLSLPPVRLRPVLLPRCLFFVPATAKSCEQQCHVLRRLRLSYCATLTPDHLVARSITPATHAHTLFFPFALSIFLCDYSVYGQLPERLVGQALDLHLDCL